MWVTESEASFWVQRWVREYSERIVGGGCRLEKKVEIRELGGGKVDDEGFESQAEALDRAEARVSLTISEQMKEIVKISAQQGLPDSQGRAWNQVLVGRESGTW